MNHVIDSLTCGGKPRWIQQADFMEIQAAFHFLNVFPLSGREIIQASDCFSSAHQLPCNGRSYKPSNTSNKIICHDDDLNDEIMHQNICCRDEACLVSNYRHSRGRLCHTILVRPPLSSSIVAEGGYGPRLFFAHTSYYDARQECRRHTSRDAVASSRDEACLVSMTHLCFIPRGQRAFLILCRLEKARAVSPCTAAPCS